MLLFSADILVNLITVHIKTYFKKNPVVKMNNLCDVRTTERPSFKMLAIQFQRKRLAFGSIPVVGSS